MTLSTIATDPRNACRYINEHSPSGGLFHGDRARLHACSRLPWRISPEPFWLSPQQAAYLERLGPALHKFYRTADQLYRQSVKGRMPSWIHAYLDQGKPPELVELGRMNRFRSHLPLVIRPDLLLTDDGFRLTELDAVPGGMGFTGQVSSLYAELGFQLVGGARGLVDGFYDAIGTTLGMDRPTVALVVSDESEAYREEMKWLARNLQERGMLIFCRHPRDVHFDENGLFLRRCDREIRLDAVYRFFELFDLKNIPKAEPIAYFAKKNAVRVTPPFKAHLEEKIWLGLFHHPVLQAGWVKALGQETMTLLAELIPRTWIMDARPLPPHAVIPGLEVEGCAVATWDALKHLPKKQRQFVVKPSGFSKLAYESRGVSIGHDLREEEWAACLEQAQASFARVPYVLQDFHKARRTTVHYYDFDQDCIRSMHGRVLLRPYYYVHGDAVHLAGIQAVICPADKKILHGMADSVLAPCAVRTSASEAAAPPATGTVSG